MDQISVYCKIYRQGTNKSDGSNLVVLQNIYTRNQQIWWIKSLCTAKYMYKEPTNLCVLQNKKNHLNVHSSLTLLTYVLLEVICLNTRFSNQWTLDPWSFPFRSCGSSVFVYIAPRLYSTQFADIWVGCS